MGDTVVKAIKEGTIWLGEITVLPNDEQGTKERLKYGVYRLTLGKIDTRQAELKDLEKSSGGGSGEQSEGFQELHPGMARVFRPKGGRRNNKEHMATEDRLAAEFEDSEAIDESIARGRGQRTEAGKLILRGEGLEAD